MKRLVKAAGVCIASGALLFAVSALRSPHPADIAWPDSPETLTIPGAPERTTVSLESEIGAVVNLVVNPDGTVEPPVLWDGIWYVRWVNPAGVQETLTMSIGDFSTRVDARAWFLLLGAGAGLLLAGSLRAGRVGRGAALLGITFVLMGGVGAPYANAHTTQRSLEGCAKKYGENLGARARCLQTVMSSPKVAGNYRAGIDAFIATRTEESGWSRLCHNGSSVAVSVAVLSGEDPSLLLREQRSVCDFSVPHGVGAAVVFLNPSNPSEALRNTCAVTNPVYGDAESLENQCWHGGGRGLAQIYRGDIEQSTSACLQAPAVDDVDNCLEGVFSFRYDYLLRSQERATWKALQVNAATCSETEVDYGPFASACYRAAARDETTALTTRIVDVDDVTEVDLLFTTNTQRWVDVCGRLADGQHTYGCWAGLGSISGSLALVAGNDEQRGELVDRSIRICLEAAERTDVTGCLDRLVKTVVINDQERRGFDLSYLVERLPQEMRETIARDTADWLAGLAGRSTLS